MSVPIFTITTYKPENTYYVYGNELLWEQAGDLTSSAFTSTFDTYVKHHKDIGTPLIGVKVTTGAG